MFRSKLSHYKSRLEYYWSKGSSLASFSSFLNQGLSSEEVVTLNALKSLIRGHIQSFVGDISERWRYYGNCSDGVFDFYPSLYIQPLRQQLQLIEMMSHSQLFIEFVDKQQSDSETTKKALKGDAGIFIAAWIYIHRRRRKRRNAMQ